VPWAAFNANTEVQGLQGANFSYLDLSAWSPGVGQNISVINYEGAVNIPWGTIPSFSGAVFSGVDLSDFIPPLTQHLAGDYTGAINIPWALMNLNTMTTWYKVNFTGQDLANWA